MKTQTIISTNPSKNYEILGEVTVSTHDEINAKLAKAKKAFPSWAQLTVQERASYLQKLYDVCEKRKNEIVSLAAQEMGMPVAIGQLIDVGIGLSYLQGYIQGAPSWLLPETVFENNQELHIASFEPRGIAGASSPWNYPFCNFMWVVGQNLIAGNTLLFKHSEECPLTAQLLDELVQASGLPEGVFNQVYGTGADVGEYVMNSAIDLIHFTGSTRVGMHLYQVAAQRGIPALLELGGSAPGIIFEDADMATTLPSVYLYRFLNSGQTCDGLKRLIVHKSIFDSVVKALTDIVRSKKIGDPLSPTTQLGPLVSERQLRSLESQVADALAKGATLITGGKQPAGLAGAYYEPTLLTGVTPAMRVWKEEVFGPVLPIVSFESEQEAIALANDTGYGLGGYIYTQNKERAMRVSRALKTGNISINGTNYVIAQDAFGGYKPSSGLGREHGRQGLRELCNTKVVAYPKAWHQ